MDPNFTNTLGDLSTVYKATGRYDLWLEELKKAAVADNDRDGLALAEETESAFSKGGIRPALTRYIEPLMIVIMGLIIGGICLAMLLPIFTISKVMGSH